LTYKEKNVSIIKEINVTAYEVSKIGIPLPKVLEAIKCGRFKANVSK